MLRNEVKSGVTICIIEHNLDIVQSISDRIAFLDQGRLLAEGEPKTILSIRRSPRSISASAHHERRSRFSRRSRWSPAMAGGRC